MTDARAKRLSLLGSAVSLLVLLGASVSAWFYFQVRASLPQLDGNRQLAGLSAPVTITRDAQGVPTVRGTRRADVARALGFLHAQDRFFQMDLLRRRAAGELAELFGKVALPIDRSTKPHRFRPLARQVLAELPPDQRTLLEAYTAGVNAGLMALKKKPFEYFVLRVAPQPWRIEDCILISYAMTLDLQDQTNGYERSVLTLRDRLGSDMLAFLAPLTTPDDAALDGSTSSFPPIPGPNILDLRTEQPVATTVPSTHATSPADRPLESIWSNLAIEQHPGSNSFALSGAHTASGVPLLANDPHLNLRVPNIWYRVALEWPIDGSNATQKKLRRVVGVTLPGLPFVVLGSNGQIAWGLTFAYADTSDLVAIDVNPVSHQLYKVPDRDELMEIETHRDVIVIKGEKPETVETQWTFWGPIVGYDSRQRPLANHWVAYDSKATNLEFGRLEHAATVGEAVAIAHESGIPPQNFLVVDSSGAMAWTIAGKLPDRVGFNGRLPVSWSFGDRRWAGFLPGKKVPTISTPAVDRIWTANNRLVGGNGLARIGDGGFASPARARQIRDALAKIEKATPPDLLAIQLDDRALFLDRWQKVLVAALTPEAIKQKSSRAELRRLVENWVPRASVESVGYRLVRSFRAATADLALGPVFAPCFETMPDFNWRQFNYEPALWALIQEKPAHLLAPSFASWDQLLLAAADQVVAELNKKGIPLERATWGARNQARIQHPFGRMLPAMVGQWLNLPADPLAGDANMPRIQSPSFGASMRLVVSPGRENEGLFEMPGGQSGHPLSPFYRAGHEAWVKGEPTPLLPGETEYTLTLMP